MYIFHYFIYLEIYIERKLSNAFIKTNEVYAKLIKTTPLKKWICRSSISATRKSKEQHKYLFFRIILVFLNNQSI